ncbi:unnamed protein product [Brachionus calyciflorus]|uniref:Uncharacterized protein n=1 Tax=Brachionus calyciflorus TaxID=104777 RepID=A0A814FDH0_9BILA|nr:unnamed protein product [Brachionus calyciflorus]
MIADTQVSSDFNAGNNSESNNGNDKNFNSVNDVNNLGQTAKSNTRKMNLISYYDIPDRVAYLKIIK